MASAIPNPFDTQQAAATTATQATTPTEANPAPQIASTPTATPQAVNVTPGQMVEDRTAKIVAEDSPIMQLARSRAEQQANSRGLINSTIAAGAGQTAVLDAATGIAKQDAATEAAAATANAKAANDMQLANQDAQIKTNTANLTAASNTNLASIEAQYKNLTTASTSAASIINKTTEMVNSIMQNTTLDAAAKQKAIDTYNANAKKSLQLIGALAGDVDLSSYLDEVLA